MMLAAAPCFVLGQDGRSPAEKDEIIQKLILRVEALEREVAALKPAGAAAAIAAPLEPAPISPQQAPAAVDESAMPDVEAKRFAFHGYSDVGFERNPDGSSVKRFVLGEVDLFATARISPRLTALVETVLETDKQIEVGNVPLNVERLLLQYRQNDYFNLDIGSYRTAIGFYSTAYLRGSWLQTSLSRPKLFTFEDDGGFLPLHNVGLSANGKLPLEGLGLHYVVEVGSSRNYSRPGRTGLDFEQNAAVNVAIYARPPDIPGFQVGFSAYHDRFSPSPGSNLARSVWTVHAVYHANRLEFLNEGILSRFHAPGLGYATLPGFYSQLAYRVGSNWTPYVRVDYVNVFGRGQIAQYAPQYVPWKTVLSGGVRYDLTDAVALKFELGRETGRLQPDFLRAAMQVAFTF